MRNNMNIEDMKCCGNCDHYDSFYEHGKGMISICDEGETKTSDSCCDKWKFDMLSCDNRKKG